MLMSYLRFMMIMESDSPSLLDSLSAFFHSAMLSASFGLIKSMKREFLQLKELKWVQMKNSNLVTSLSSISRSGFSLVLAWSLT